MFGTVLENVVLDHEHARRAIRRQSITENTRASYPLHYISKSRPERTRRPPAERRLADRRRVWRAAADRAADAGAGHVLLPVRLHGQGGRHGARRHRAAGDVQRLLRRGVPGVARRRCTPTCSGSACCTSTGSRVWLVNTGWTGGPYGVGTRMPLAHTRAHGARGAGRCARQHRRRRPIRSSASPCRRHAPGVPPMISAATARYVEGWSHLRRAGTTPGRDVRTNFEKFGDRGGDAVRQGRRLGASIAGSPCARDHPRPALEQHPGRSASRCA